MKCNLLLLLLITTIASAQNKNGVNLMLDNWHRAAGNANFTEYFDALSNDAIYIGTDATENWTKKQFETFAKPYFDKGKAWNFIALERNVYFSNDGKTAWFDELLNTQMKLCRGSGVLVKINKKWKIKHYVLSMTVPNETTNDVVKIKSELENAIIKKKE